MEIIKSQYKEQQNIIKNKETKFEEIVKIAEKAANEALKYKNESKERDTQIISLHKQLEEKKKQLAAAASKISKLSNNIMGDLTKQLEAKIKEIEMLKEMLRSSKIELTGKDKEIKRLKSKKAATNRSKYPAAVIKQMPEPEEEQYSPEESIMKSATAVKDQSNSISLN